jgi:hypothetical protein
MLRMLKVKRAAVTVTKVIDVDCYLSQNAVVTTQLATSHRSVWLWE